MSLAPPSPLPVGPFVFPTYTVGEAPCGMQPCYLVPFSPVLVNPLAPPTIFPTMSTPNPATPFQIQFIPGLQYSQTPRIPCPATPGSGYYSATSTRGADNTNGQRFYFQESA